MLKETINNMVDRLSIFSNEVQRVAKDVGVDGKMGGQADVAGIGGRWKEITTGKPQISTIIEILRILANFIRCQHNGHELDCSSQSFRRHHQRCN